MLCLQALRQATRMSRSMAIRSRDFFSAPPLASLLQCAAGLQVRVPRLQRAGGILRPCTELRLDQLPPVSSPENGQFSKMQSSQLQTSRIELVRLAQLCGRSVHHLPSEGQGFDKSRRT